MSAIFLFILVVCDMHLLGLGILSASIYYYILTSYAPFSIYFSIWLPIYCCAMLAGCVCLASAMYLATCMLLYYANRNRGEQRQVPKGRRPQAKNALFSWEPFCCLLGLCLAGCSERSFYVWLAAHHEIHTFVWMHPKYTGASISELFLKAGNAELFDQGNAVCREEFADMYVQVAVQSARVAPGV